MKSLTRKLAGVVSLLILCQIAVLGAPFAKKIPFTQPDGTQIMLWGQGDEFHAVFETLDGYTVIFNQQTKAYDYAALSADGDQLISTGVAVGQGDPAALGLRPHVRINPEAVKKQAAERFARWDQAMGLTRRWNDLKAARQLAELAVAKGGPEPSPPSSTTTGQKLGLTLLIDFSDAVGTIAQAEITNFCNGDTYTGYGNNGSVKKYYLDNSNNQLTYSNVVTIYIRVPQPKTYYNNTANDCGIQGRLLINDAITAMKALPNYSTVILPTFANLTVDGSSQVVACNVFFAGSDSGVWSYGLWPHSWVLAGAVDLGNGKKVYKYQITNLGSSLELGTFCHENGHMLCGFPDIYDYGYDSTGGAGMFCLMDYGGSGGNPVQVCAYLKRAAGWATTVALTSNSVLTASISSSGTDFNKFYRYAKPGVSTEYYLVENRQKSGRDANLPASGVAIWHIDELGNKDDQRTNFNTSHLNYEVSLMQADNLWHFQNDFNSGDSKDLYYLGNTATGYSNRFSDVTSPSARWWDGSASSIRFHHFSATGTTMTFGVGPEGPNIVLDSAALTAEGCMPANGAIDPNEMVVVNFALKNTGGGSTTNLVVTLLATNGVTLPSGPQTYGALVTNGAAVTRPFTFTATGTCGDALAAVLQLQDGTNNLDVVTSNFTLGAPGSPVAANYSSGGVFVTIPDLTTVEVPITVPDVGTVADVNVRVRLDHTWDSDLEISLVHPDGTVVTLASNRGGSDDNFGSGATSCAGTFTVFDDAASAPISSGSAPFAGTYQPEQLLSTLNGKAMNGTWKLRVVDIASYDVGTIYCFQLDITRQAYACCTSSADLGVALASSPDPVVGGQNLTYTLSVTNLGPDPASSVTLTDTLPASVTFVSASAGCVNLGGKVVATVGTLSSGSASNFTVVVTPNVGGLITNTLTVATLTPDSNSVNNSATNVTTVNAPPIITVQPNSQTAIAGTNVTLQVIAAGTAPLAYQWRFNGTNLAEEVNATLTLTNVLAAQAGTYTVWVTNGFGSVPSSNAVLTVLDPFIVGQPQNQFVAAGATASFTVSAQGTLPLSYQWRKEGSDLVNGQNISSAQTASLTVSNVLLGDLGNYSVIVSNLNGWVVSSNAALTAPFPPVILAQPASQTVMAGSMVTFTVGAVGPGLTYKWKRAGTNLADGGKISGSTTAGLTVSNAQGADMIAYSVGVSNSYGGVISSNALLALWPLAAWGYNSFNQSDVPARLSNVLAVAGGYYHNLALRADGTVAAWGAGASGQTNVPAGLTNVAAVSAGVYHNLAAKSDGTVTAWGYNNSGQTNVPAGLANVATVAAGFYHSLALKANGTVVAWGLTNSGSPNCGQTNVPGGLTNVVGIAAGWCHCLALRADGTVVAWGAGTNNSGANQNYGQSLVPEGLSNVVAVAAGAYHSLVLKADGTVVAWGAGITSGSSPHYGQSLVPEGLSNVVVIASGTSHSAALRADGSIAAWGAGTTNTGSSPHYGQATVPGSLTNVVSLAAGGYHNVVLEGDGHAFITTQPFNQTAAAGATVRFLALAIGLQPLSYQWQRAGTNLADATTASLTLANVQCSDAGAYTLLVSNSLGTTLSSTATLTISDTTPPTVICPPDVTLAANAGCSATNVALGIPLTGDNCEVAAVTNNGPASYPVGTNVVLWTVTDNSGNTNWCQQQVIIWENQSPTIAWYMTNVVVAAGANCQALMPDITGTNYILAADNCSSVVVTQSVATNVVLSLGTTEVVLGALDAGGNAAYCTNYVVVVDPTPPIITCPTNIVISADEGQCSKSNMTWEVTASDNCAVTNVVSEPPSGSTFPVGVTTVRCSATDASGNTNLCSFTVSVIAPTYILAHPVSQTVTQGQDVTFTVSATNDCGIGLTSQWRWNGGEIAGATGSTYTRTNAQCADVGNFDAVVASLAGSLTSSVAALVVVAPPVILSGPTDQTVPLGQDVTFCLSATNDCGGQLTYQWRFQGVEISGATTNCYTYTTFRLTNTGSYDVVVANPAAAVTSPAALLTVVGPYLTVSVEPGSTGGGRTNFIFAFPSVTGIDYIVQYKDTLQDTNDWLPLITNSGSGGLITNEFPITTDPSGRFYRILLP